MDVSITFPLLRFVLLFSSILWRGRDLSGQMSEWMVADYLTVRSRAMC